MEAHITVASVEFYEEDTDVFDIEVEIDHSFRIAGIIAHNSTLDLRTTEICRALSGKVWRLPDFQPVGHDKAYPGATAHWGCRSRQIPVLRSWEELSGKALPSIGDEELLEATKQHLLDSGMMDAEEVEGVTLNKNAKQLDGEPAGMKDFNDWMQGKSDATINKLLGPGRAELWKTGKATVSDMTDQNNRPLTIAQLKAKIEQGIAPPETLGVPFLPQSKAGAKFEPEPPPPAKPTLSPADADAQDKINGHLSTKSNQKLMNQVLTAHPDASPEAQLATFTAMKLAKDIAAKLTDEAAQKAVETGKASPSVMAVLKKLDPEDPAQAAWDDKILKAELIKEQKDAKEKAAKELADLTIAAGKKLVELSAKSPAHLAAVEEALKLNPTNTMAALADVPAILDLNANAKLHSFSEGKDGAGLVLKAKASALLKAKPDAGHDDLLQVQAAAAEAQAMGTTNAVLNAAAKNMALGKKLTAKQQAAVDDMFSDEAAAFAVKVQSIKDSHAAKAAAAIETGPDLKVQNLAQPVPNPDTLTFVKTLPGSTSPGLYTDDAGKQWVIKKPGATSLAHVESEVLADAIYRAAGAKVPFSAMATMDGKPVKIAEFLPGGTELAQAATAANFAKAKTNFVLDALLGNWDAVGTGKNNMLVVGEDVWRIDNGGALKWRAMGDPKDAKWLTPKVQELSTLLNGKLNSDAADVYKGITQSEVHQQIADLLSRRDAILDAASPDPEVRRLLSDRLDWLQKQLPAGMQPAAKTTAAAVPGNIEALVQKASAAGYALALDGPEIEDNNVLLWRERGTDGAERLKAQLKVTDAGGKIIEEALKKAGANISGASTPTVSSANNKAHPADSVWSDLLVAAKHIGAHASDGQYNEAKTAILNNFGGKLSAGLTTLKGKAIESAADMQDYYARMVKDLKNAMATKSKPKNENWKQFEVTPEKPKGATIEAPAAPAGPLPGWSIKRLDNWERPTGTVKDGVVVLDGGTNGQTNVGRGWEMTKGPVTLRFASRDGGGYAARTMFGTVEISVHGGGPAAVNQALASLSELGIDTAATPAPFKELLYLHKGFYQRNRHNDSAYAAIYNDAAMPIEAKITKIKDLAEKTFGVKLPRKESEWGPDYDPNGYVSNLNSSGYRFFSRWDIPPRKMEKEMDGWQLHHASSNIIGAVKGWLAAGATTSTYDRLRTGVPLKEGASSLEDMDSGGAVHFFNNVVRKTNGASGFRFKIRNLARLDAVSQFGDTFGRYSSYPSRVATISDFKQMGQVGKNYDHALLKGGLSFVEEVETIIVSSDKERKEIVKAFADAGWTTLPDGRKVADIVITK